MTTIVFDLETTAIPPEGIQGIDKIHCLAAKCVETGREYFATTQANIACLLMTTLQNAQSIIGHNIIGFDIPVLQKFFPDFKPTGQVVDTLVMSRALWHDVMIRDFGRTKAGRLPARLRGSHKLEAYGYRLGILKGEFCHDTDWAEYTDDMGEYCKQDVIVTEALYNKIVNRATPEMIELECEFAQIIHKQELHGVYFDEASAIELMTELRKAKQELVTRLQEAFPMRMVPVNSGKVFKSKVNNRNRYITKGAEFCKIKEEEFNPSSRPQIADRLISLGWEPEEMTEKGSVIVNERVLKGLDYPEAKLLTEYLTIDKRLGQLADGNQGWLKKVGKDSRIHGRVNTGGAISGRCTHSNPNLAQVPAVDAPFGSRCRSLFSVPSGYKLVGCDASGLELRCLAHYLARYDGGDYADIVLHGDIHTANQEAAGLPERNMAKTFIYGWLYGAGPEKIGKIVGGGIKEGSKLQSRFMKKFPAIKKLKEGVSKVVKERGYLKGLDGRRMRTRSEHSALNLLLQGAGALVMKRALIECDRLASKAGLDYHFVLNIHDEWQAEVAEEHADEFGRLSVEAIRKVGKYFDFRIPLDGEAKIGNNWAETH